MAVLLSDVIPDPLPCATYDNLPDCEAINELKSIPHWVAWQLKPVEGKDKPTKVPISARTGFGASHSDPATWAPYSACVERVRRSRLAGVGFVLSDDDEFTGVDLDNCIDLQTGDIDAWAQEIIDYAETYAEISPSGTGIRLWVRGKLAQSVKVAGVEIYVRKRFLTVTGWHIYTTPTIINPAPRTIAALMARAHKPEPVARSPMPALPRIEGRSAYVQAALDDECARIASAPDGAKNNTVNEAAFNIGQLCPHALSLAEATSALEQAALAAGIPAKDRVFGPNGTIARALRDGMKQPRSIPERDDIEIDQAAVSAFIRQNDGTLIDRETGEIIEDAPASPPPSFPYPPGLVGDIARWIVASSTKPQPLLAIGAALGIVGTAAGGAYCGPTRVATHLYILSLAPTGQGKDVPLKAIRTLLKAAGLQGRVGPDDFTAAPAVINFLHRAPVAICPMDEFGAFLRRINARKASGFEAAISKVLRSTWSCNFEELGTSEYAGRASETIQSPGLSIFGATTAEEFYRGIAAGDASNGVLNRFLLLRGDDKPVKVANPTANPFAPPASIVDALKAIHRNGPIMPGELAPDPYFDGVPARPVRWAGDGSEAIYQAIGAAVEAMVEAENPDHAFFARVAEMAQRIATIIAIGRTSSTVSADDMQWASDLAMWSARSMADGVREHAAENDHQANYKMVRGIVEKAGELSRNELVRKIQGRIEGRALEGIIKSLCEAGEIGAITEAPTAKGGRPKTVFKAIKRG